MAAIESKLAEALNEIKNIREALGNEVQERRRDHDELVKLKERVITLFNKAASLEQKDKDVEDELKKLRPLIEKVDTLITWKAAKEKEEKSEVVAAVKDGKKRSWQFWLMVLGAVLTALATAVAGGWVAKYMFK